MSKEYSSSKEHDPTFEADKLKNYQEVDRAMAGERPLLHEMPWRLMATKGIYALYSSYRTGDDAAIFLAEAKQTTEPVIDLTDASLWEFSGREFDAFTKGVVNNEFYFGNPPLTLDQKENHMRRLAEVEASLRIAPTERRLTLAMDMYRQIGTSALDQPPEPTQQ
jgi:hypothetical protein